MESDFLRLARRVKDVEGGYLKTNGGVVSGDLDVAGALTNNGHAVWCDGNDGAGSGLDADTVDKHHVSDLMKNYASVAHPVSHTDDATFPRVNAFGSGGSQGAAALTFYRNGNYAAHFGLDTDNVLKVGGWSMGSNAYKIWHQGTMPYEEGSWAPTLVGSAIYGNATYSYRSGTYQRIGNWVRLCGYIYLSNKGGMSGNVMLGGLPFTAANWSSGTIGSEAGTASAIYGRPLHFQMDAGATRAGLIRTTTSTSAYVGTAEISDNLILIGIHLEYPIS
jgi:hypothetical protein